MLAQTTPHLSPLCRACLPRSLGSNSARRLHPLSPSTPGLPSQRIRPSSLAATKQSALRESGDSDLSPIKDAPPPILSQQSIRNKHGLHRKRISENTGDARHSTRVGRDG